MASRGQTPTPCLRLPLLLGLLPPTPTSSPIGGPCGRGAQRHPTEVEQGTEHARSLGSRPPPGDMVPAGQSGLRTPGSASLRSECRLCGLWASSAPAFGPQERQLRPGCPGQGRRGGSQDQGHILLSRESRRRPPFRAPHPPGPHRGRRHPTPTWVVQGLMEQPGCGHCRERQPHSDGF